MAGARKITTRVFQVAGPDVTGYYDSAVYLVDLGEPVLIDSSLGISFREVVSNIIELGFRPESLKTVILTHCHMDHIGGSFLFREQTGASLIMHEYDAEIVERGDNRLTAAFCFNMKLQPTMIDIKLKGEKGALSFRGGNLSWFLTPGHTPGSISLAFEDDGKKILFGQDIAAPLLKEFDCDPVAWKSSIRKLIDYDADIFCDGHSGPIFPREDIRQYLGYLLQSRGS